MKKNDLVSILVVSYNAEKYIKKTILSCLKQTYNNIEVLLLDNNSKDKTVEIAKEIQKNDARLKIFESKENLGPYGGLNFLLDRASGEFIAIQDHDDIWLPTKIEKQVNFLKNNNKFIACGTRTYYFYESRNILTVDKKQGETNFVVHTSLMFRNKNFQYNTDFLLADEHFEKIILKRKGKIYCLSDVLTIYRIKKDKSNLSISRFKLSFKNLKEFFSLNQISLNSLAYLFFLVFNKFIPANLEWFIRKNITQRKFQWITKQDFLIQNQEIDL